MDPRPAVAAATQGAQIRVVASDSFQVMSGWEATAQAGQEFPEYPKYRDELLERAVDQLGINRLRVAVRSGSENPRDVWSEMRHGRLTDKEWRCQRYWTVNDDADPSHINPAGFHFSDLDNTIEQVVLPMRRLMAARGEHLYVNVNYTAFTSQICNGLGYIHLDPDEYAEFAVAVFTHLRDKYDLVPDAWEMILEPDNYTVWSSGQLVGLALVRTAARLEAAGFTPEFIAPSTKRMDNAVDYLDAMSRIPGAAELVSELSYHRYGGVSDETLRAIADRARRFGIRTSMLEQIRAGPRELYKDLTEGQVSAWQEYTLAYPSTKDNGGKYFLIDREQNPPRVMEADRARYLAQYFLPVRMGARRIGASTTSAELRPVAFVNPDGGTVVVVDSDRGARFGVQGLPAGPYRITYTTADSTAAHAGTVDLPGSRVLDVGIPAPGVLTIEALSDRVARGGPARPERVTSNGP